jgi:hypothetical protein
VVMNVFGPQKQNKTALKGLLEILSAASVF